MLPWCSDDHSRVYLQRNNIDYINANIVQAPQANRHYILTQVCTIGLSYLFMFTTPHV